MTFAKETRQIDRFSTASERFHPVAIWTKGYRLSPCAVLRLASLVDKLTEEAHTAKLYWKSYRVFGHDGGLMQATLARPFILADYPRARQVRS